MRDDELLAELCHHEVMWLAYPENELLVLLACYSGDLYQIWYEGCDWPVVVETRFGNLIYDRGRALLREINLAAQYARRVWTPLDFQALHDHWGMRDIDWCHEHVRRQIRGFNGDEDHVRRLAMAIYETQVGKEG